MEKASEVTGQIGGLHDDMQGRVRLFVDQYQLHSPIDVRTLDLVSEVGEIAKEVVKGSNYGKEPFKITNGFAEELGDVLFSLICVANEAGVDLEKALENVMEKYAARFERKGDVGSGR